VSTRGNGDYVTPRELHEKLDEVEDKIDARFDKVDDYIGKSKVAFAVLFLLLASPKAGGPSADQVVAGALKLFA
jgi:hypothetical protein